MSNHKENQSENISDDEYDFTQTDHEYSSRVLYPSIINKSSIHVYSQMNCNLKEIPDYPENTQKLNLSNNALRFFPDKIRNLKEINLNRNQIEKIPIQINEISSLVILRMNHNKITTLPFLKYVRHLQLYHNPIKVITSKLSQTHLEYIVFDWVPFLLHPHKNTHENQSFRRICMLISKVDMDEFDQFIEFDRLFQENLKITNYPISYFLHKGIYRESEFFIEYLINYHNDINFNEMMHLDRYLLEQVLEEQFKPAFTLFMLKKSNLVNKQTFIANILLACKFNNSLLFNFFINSVKRSTLVQYENKIIETLLKNYQDKSNKEMLRKILKCAGYSKQNKKKLELPSDYSLLEGQAIAHALISILSDKELRQSFDWQDQAQRKQPLLHFAVQTRRPQLVKLLIKSGFQVDKLNNEGKKARYIRGSIVSRKILWKHQKQLIQKRLFGDSKQAFSQVSNIESMNLESNKKWFEYIFEEQPIKIKNREIDRQFAWLNRLPSKEIDRIENKIEDQGAASPKLKILHIGSPKRANSITSQILFPSSDQSGLLLEYWMLYKEKNSHFITKKMGGLKDKPEQLNSLAAYQYFQYKLVHQTEHSYIKPTIKTSFFQNINFCTDVEDLSEQEHREYIVTLGNRNYSGIRESQIELFDVEG